MYSFGDNEYGQVGVDSKEQNNGINEISLLKGKKIISIVCGYGHTLALTSIIFLIIL